MVLTRGSPAHTCAFVCSFGPNFYPEPPLTGWWALFFESFKDVTLIILCIAAVVSFAVGVAEDPGHGWIDGVAILIAVLIVAVVTATNDYQKERQFRALSAVSDDVEIKVRCRSCGHGGAKAPI